MIDVTLRNKTLLAAAITAALLALAGCSDNDDNASSAITPERPALPSGTGEEFTVATPSDTYPLPAKQYAENNADGSLRFRINDNPIAYLLRGHNDIWQGTSDVWQNNANGDGPDNYLSNPIRNAEVWRANIQYVIDATQRRSDDEAILAFLDDMRSKNYSVIDGLGPLTGSYVSASGAYTDIPVPSTSQVLSDANYKASHNDGIAYAGDTNSELGDVVRLVDAFRQRSPASTNASKYIFSTPRPWRMNDNGDVEFLRTEANYPCGTDSVTYDVYNSSVSVVPGLICARRAHSASNEAKGLYTPTTENRRKDGGYPSGHTNAGYLASMAYAYAIPQRYAEMLTRGSLLGESRIMAGMHSPADVIGGRIHSMIVASYALNQPDIANEADEAYQQAQQYFGGLAKTAGMDLYDYAHRNVENERSLAEGGNVTTEVFDNNWFNDRAANRANYRERMTYNLPQDVSQAGQPVVVPLGAESLLRSRLPYLSDAQRRAVLYTTAVDSGYPLLDKTNGWGRLDLVTAADGYAAFEGDVLVTMDAEKGGFNARDGWYNDIDGEGRLTKAGTGELILAGNNTYTGGTLVQGGTLSAASQTAFGRGDVYVQDGTLRVAPTDAERVQIDGNFTLEAGTLAIDLGNGANTVGVDQLAYIEGSTLNLDFGDQIPAAGTLYTIVDASNLFGQFSQVVSDSVDVELDYSAGTVVATVL